MTPRDFYAHPDRTDQLNAQCASCGATLVSDGTVYACDACGTHLGDAGVSRGAFGDETTYERYRNSGKIRLRGGYTEAYPDERTTRDGDILTGEGVSL